MSDNRLNEWCEAFLSGQLTAEQFRESVLSETDSAKQTKEPPDREPGTDIDLDRQRRCGFPEVIYGEGKTADSIGKIIRRLLNAGENVLATRVDAEKARILLNEFPDASYHPAARTFRLNRSSGKNGPDEGKRGKVAVLSAGTSDFPVAAEAAETAQWTGAEVIFIQDVGVAGPHRLRARLPEIADADAVVVVAGMEGALPSVVGGYVAVPVIAVPTSVGYGTAFGGITPLLGMLNSCASNVTVVNVDAGFKGGYVAGLIAAGASKK